MALGKRLTALELPEEEADYAQASPVSPAPADPVPVPARRIAAASRPTSILLPPIPAAPRREIMIQLSIKAPLALIERLEGMTKATGAQKQAILAAALDAYLQGHGY